MLGLHCIFNAITHPDILAAKGLGILTRLPTIMFLIVGLNQLYDDFLRVISTNTRFFAEVKTMVFLVTAGGANEDSLSYNERLPQATK
jgi:hypothetical protein